MRIPRISIASAATGYRRRSGVSLVCRFSAIDLHAGDFVAVVGRNGAGKSTLLRSLCGLQELLSGEILLDGRPLSSYEPPALAKKIAVVLTERVGGFNLKVKDVVANGQVPYTDAFHRLREGNWRIVDDAMRRCGVYEYRSRPIDELSDGMLQKTMIARAIAQQAEIILLDEPTAFLDYAARNELFIFLNQEALNGKCVIVSTHELDLALRFCTRVLIVHDGASSLVTAVQAAGDERLQAIAGGHLR